MENTKFVYPRSPLESLLTEKALAIVNDSGSHAFFDSLLEKNPDAFPVKMFAPNSLYSFLIVLMKFVICLASVSVNLLKPPWLTLLRVLMALLSVKASCSRLCRRVTDAFYDRTAFKRI